MLCHFKYQSPHKTQICPQKPAPSKACRCCPRDRRLHLSQPRGLSDGAEGHSGGCGHCGSRREGAWPGPPRTQGPTLQTEEPQPGGVGDLSLLHRRRHTCRDWDGQGSIMLAFQWSWYLPNVSWPSEAARAPSCTQRVQSGPSAAGAERPRPTEPLAPAGPGRSALTSDDLPQGTAPLFEGP